MSSRRPTKGLTNVAPTLAASSACVAEKTSVTFTRIPSDASVWQASTPGFPNGTFTTMWASMPASSRPSRTMPPTSVETTSALTGPLTVAQISLSTVRGSPPALASSEGFVVTPSTIPSGARLAMSFTFPESTNSFIGLLLFAGARDRPAARDYCGVSLTRFDGSLTFGGTAVSSATTAYTYVTPASPAVSR